MLRFRRYLQRDFHLFLLSGALILSACSSSFEGRPSPKAYSCGDFGGRAHCHAIGTLSNHLTGFRTTMDIAGRFLPGNGFVNNEFWLNNYSGQGGWIEVGYQITRLTPTPHYFWAKLDPVTTRFERHDITDIPQDEIGSKVVFDIHQTGDDTFVITIDGNTTHFRTDVHIHLWRGTYGGHVQVGQELAGSQGAIASLATFADNHVYDNTFRRRYATELDWRLSPDITKPSEGAEKPPYGTWLLQPAAGNRGGGFATYCCAE